jgi:hypothetical protein
MQRTLERELLQASGKTRTCQTQVHTKLLSATCLCCPVANLFSTKLACQVNATHWEGSTNSCTAGEPVAPALDKTVGQIHGGNISLLPGAGEQNVELKWPLWGMEWLRSCCGENQALHCFGETGSKLKLSLTKIKNSSLTHRLALWVEGAGDCLFTNSSQEHFWESACSWGPTPLRKPRVKHPELNLPKLSHREEQHSLQHIPTF